MPYRFVKKVNSVIFATSKSALVYAVSLTAIVILALWVAPVFVDVEQFRPGLRKIISEELNAKVDFDHLDFKVLGGLCLSARSIKVFNIDGELIAEADSIEFKMSFFSILRGEARSLITVNRPKIDFSTGADGKISFLKVLSDDHKFISLFEAGGKSAEMQAGGLVSWLLNSQIDLSIKNIGRLDPTSESETVPFDLKLFPSLDIFVFDLKKSGSSAFEVFASNPQEVNWVFREFRLNGEIILGVDEYGRKSARLEWFGTTEVESPEWFQFFVKNQKTSLETKGAVQLDSTKVVLSSFSLEGMGLKFSGQGQIDQLKEKTPELEVMFVSNPVDLSGVGKYFMLPLGLSLTGRLDIEFKLKSELDRLKATRSSQEDLWRVWTTELMLNGQSVVLDHKIFKVRPVLGFTARSIKKFRSNLGSKDNLEKDGDELDCSWASDQSKLLLSRSNESCDSALIKAKIEAPGSDLAVNAEVLSFENKIAQVDLSSGGIDSRQFLDTDQFAIWKADFLKNLDFPLFERKVQVSLDVRKLWYQDIVFESLKTKQKDLNGAYLFLLKAYDRALARVTKSHPERSPAKVMRQPSPEDLKKEEDIIKKFGF